MPRRKGNSNHSRSGQPIRPLRPQGGFQLPPDVSFSKERLSVGWVYVFQHASLGYLGRMVRQERPDGQPRVISEVAGDPDDPITAQRAAIFTPLSTVLTRRLNRATVGSGARREAEPPGGTGVL